MTQLVKPLFVFFAKALPVALLVVSVSAFAETNHSRPSQEEPPEKPPVQLGPAQRYSGRTPIELRNGILFNNGTFGEPNPDHESWAQDALVVPNVSEKHYPYVRKDDFVKGLEESDYFVDSAIQNWDYSVAHPTEVTKPEVIEYAKNASSTMKPLLERFRKATGEARHASEGNWDNAQADARKALAEMRGTYSQLHHNVH